MEFEIVIGIKIEKLTARIRGCQHLGHIQQVAFSTSHDCLTQVCFGCEEVRTSMEERELEERKDEE